MEELIMNSKLKTITVGLLIAIAATQSMQGMNWFKENLHNDAQDVEQYLIEAARNGDINRVKILVERGVDLNKADKNGWTALHAAARHGRIETVKILVAHDADLNKADKDGWAALYWAACNGHTEIARSLVESGANINALKAALQWAGRYLGIATLLNNTIEYYEGTTDKVDANLDYLALATIAEFTHEINNMTRGIFRNNDTKDAIREVSYYIGLSARLNKEKSFNELMTSVCTNLDAGELFPQSSGIKNQLIPYGTARNFRDKVSEKALQHIMKKLNNTDIAWKFE